MTAVAVAGVLAACGSSESSGPLTKAQYEDRVTDIIKQMNKNGSGITEPTDGDKASEATAMQKLADVLQDGSDDLAALHPPAEVKSANADMSRAFHELAQASEHAIVALDDGDTDQALAEMQAQALATNTPERMRRALTTFQRLHYDVGANQIPMG
jgi:hypothetical protein